MHISLADMIQSSLAYLQSPKSLIFTSQIKKFAMPINLHLPSLILLVRRLSKIRINRNYNKQNKSNTSMSSSGKQFVIIKFQPNNILLLHKPSKKAYQYFQCPAVLTQDPQITHPALLRHIRYNNGLLYPKEKSTLEAEIDNRKRAFGLLHFTEEEIVNTFTPVIQCLLQLHAEDTVHGRLSASNIVVTEEEEVKVRDWLVEPSDNIYYFNKRREEITKDDDWIALGQLLLQAASLKKNSKLFLEKDLPSLIDGLLQRFSRGFIFALFVLLKRNKERFPQLLGYLKNEEKLLADLELSSLYESLKKEKEKKKIAVCNENVNILPNMNSLKPLALSLNESPVKKPNNGSLGSTLRRVVKQDSENKRVGNQELKKRQIQKINKIIERSNEFVNELMARKNNEHILKKIAPKPNIANISIYSQNTKKTIKDSPVTASPNKKIRAISRKK